MKFSKNNVEYRKMQKGYLFVNGIAINETAFKIWNMCSDDITKEKILGFFYNEYQPETDTEKKLINDDINTCLTDLVEANLLLVQA